MDSFRLALDRLDRDSKELILAAQQAACEAVLHHQVLPSHVALALAQRFTPERIDDSFSALCLIDALLRLPRLDTVTAEGSAAKAILDAFMKSAPSLFTAFQRVRDDGMMRKCERLVRRWGSNKLISGTLETQLLAAMTTKAEHTPTRGDHGQEAVASTAAAMPEAVAHPSPSSSTTAAVRSEGTVLVKGTASASSSASPTSAPAPPLHRVEMTLQEVEVAAHTLRNCLAILERLPPERAFLYVQLLDAEDSLSPGLMPTSLSSLQGLWGDLQRDPFVLSARGLGSAAASAVGPGSRGDMTGGGDATRPANASATSAPSEATAALAQFLEQLSAAESGTHTAVLAGPASGHALPPALAAPTQPIRYVSPLLTDAHALQSLQHRPGGHGPLLARKVTTGPAGAGYYPRFSSRCVSRCFRPHVAAAAASHTRCQRRAFPTSHEWVSVTDMERIALLTDEAEDQPLPRKRERE